MVMQTNTHTAFSLSESDKTVWDHMLQNTSEHSNSLQEQGEPTQRKYTVVRTSLPAVHVFSVIQSKNFYCGFFAVVTSPWSCQVIILQM